MQQKIVIALCSLAMGFPFLETSFAQGSRDELSQVAGLAACSFVLVLPVIYIIVGIYLGIWVLRDAKARNMDTMPAIGLAWFTVLTTIIGLTIYKIMRPQGPLVPCANCAKNRLESLDKCPLCGK